MSCSAEGCTPSSTVRRAAPRGEAARRVSCSSLQRGSGRGNRAAPRTKYYVPRGMQRRALHRAASAVDRTLRVSSSPPYGPIQSHRCPYGRREAYTAPHGLLPPRSPMEFPRVRGHRWNPHNHIIPHNPVVPYGVFPTLLSPTGCPQSRRSLRSPRIPHGSSRTLLSPMEYPCPP